MLVCVDFELNGVRYHIERGRKPNVLKYQIGDVETDEQQGDSRETQHAIEKQLNMSHEMFKHLVALNTYTQPFLSLGTNDQRDIIEQLLGITLLSEKAEALKEQNKSTKFVNQPKSSEFTKKPPSQPQRTYDEIPKRPLAPPSRPNINIQNKKQA